MRLLHLPYNPAQAITRFALGAAASAFCLWLAFRRVDFAVMQASILAVDATWAALSAACGVAAQLLRAQRFRITVRPFSPLSWVAGLRISGLGSMLIVLLPLRIGELARPYLLQEESGAPLSAGLGAAATERVIDGLMVTLLFFAATSQLGTRTPVPVALRLAAWGALAIFLLASVILGAALASQERVLGLVRRCGDVLAPKISDRVAAVLVAFLSGLQALGSRRAVLSLGAWTLLYWAAQVAAMHCLIAAFAWALPPVAALLVLCVLVIGIMVPAGPGFLGTYQGAILAGLAVFGVSPTAAAAYGMVAYTLGLATTVATGLPGLFHRVMMHRGSAQPPASSRQRATSLPAAELQAPIAAD